MSPARVTTIVWALAGVVCWSGYRPGIGVNGVWAAAGMSVTEAMAPPAAPGPAASGQGDDLVGRRASVRRQVVLMGVMLFGVVLLFALWMVYRRWLVRLKRLLAEREKRDREGAAWDAWEESARRIKTPSAEELEEGPEK